MVATRGRNLVYNPPIQVLVSLRLSSYLRDRETIVFIVRNLLLQFSNNFTKIGSVYHSNLGGDLKLLVLLLLNSFRQNGLAKKFCSHGALQNEKGRYLAII